MISDRKKPGVPFWATVVLVVALVGYPLSFGPACWVTSHTGFGAGILPAVYWPLIRKMNPNIPNWFNYQRFGGRLPRTGDTVSYSVNDGVISWYASLLAAEGWHWFRVEQYGVLDPDDLDLGYKWVWQSNR